MSLINMGEDNIDYLFFFVFKMINFQEAAQLFMKRDHSNKWTIELYSQIK